MWKTPDFAQNISTFQQVTPWKSGKQPWIIQQLPKIKGVKSKIFSKKGLTKKYSQKGWIFTKVMNTNLSFCTKSASLNKHNAEAGQKEIINKKIVANRTQIPLVYEAVAHLVSKKR